MTFPTCGSISFAIPIFHTDCKSDGAGQVPQAPRQCFVYREFFEDCGWINTCGRMKASVRQSEKLGVSTVLSGCSRAYRGLEVSVTPLRVEGAGPLCTPTHHSPM